MGGGSQIKDRILCALPFPEPVDIINQLRDRFSSAEITYIYVQYDGDRKPITHVPIGNLKLLLSDQSGFGIIWKTGISIELAKLMLLYSIYKKHRNLTTVIETFHDKTIIVTFSVLPPSPADCPHLELVHFFSAGVNHVYKSPIYQHTDITLTTSSGIHGPQIAEWVIMTYLIRSHHYDLLYEKQKRKEWAKDSFASVSHKVRDLAGQRLGVLGYGSIGRQVGRVAKAMGMDVVAYTATPKDTPEKKRDSGYIVPGTGDPDGDIPVSWYSGLDKQSLHEFLRQDIDILLVSVPLTNETRQMLSASEFEILSRKNAFITNISRGQIIDQTALVGALHHGTIRGAALDVTDPEPLPPTDPLWDAPNVTITPHISGAGASYTDRAFDVLTVNLLKRARGEKLINVVDRKRGY